MAKLRIDNLPDELYEAIKDRARRNRRSISDEVIWLRALNCPTGKELRARKRFVKLVKRFQSAKAPSPGPFPSTEEMIREDRER